MNRLSEKLKDQQGASIIIALLFFLMCTILGGIILMSAHTAAGRIDNVREEEQAYLTVASAAEVLQHEMSSVEAVYTRSRTIHTRCPDPEIWTVPSISFTGPGILQQVLQNLYNSYPNSEVQFTIEAPNFSNVAVEAKMSATEEESMIKSTAIVFELKEENLNYSLSFKMIATYKEDLPYLESSIYHRLWDWGYCYKNTYIHKYRTNWEIDYDGIKRSAQ